MMSHKTNSVIASSLLVLSSLASAQGLPGMRGADHIGITLPDLR
jgi:hypothetical protein